MSFVSLFREISTSSVSDALDRMGLPGSCMGLHPLAPGTKLIGEAFTVRYHASAGGKPLPVGDYIDSVPEGAVVVVDNGGRMDCSVWGDILTSVAVSRRLAGTVIDGVCRDTEKTMSMGYPMYCRGKFMRTGAYRLQLAETGGVVSISSVKVSPGDVVIGDEDGVVIVPREHAEAVAREARAIEERDGRTIGRIAGGKSLADSK